MAWKKQLLDGDLLTVRKNSGADVGTRKRLNFIEGSDISLTIADDVAGDEIDITTAVDNLPTSKITSGTFVAARVPILPTDRYGSAVLVSGTRAMTGDLDFAKHQAKAMAFEVLGSAPASPATAQMYYNTSTDKVMIYVA